jgi:hypothetical protein
MSERDVHVLPSKRLKAFVLSQTQPPQRSGEGGGADSSASTAQLMKDFRQCAASRSQLRFPCHFLSGNLTVLRPLFPDIL